MNWRGRKSAEVAEPKPTGNGEPQKNPSEKSGKAAEKPWEVWGEAATAE